MTLLRFGIAILLFFTLQNLSLLAQDTSELLKEARTQQRQDNLANALRYYLQAVAQLEKTNDSTALYSVYTEIGTIYQEGGLQDKAIEYFRKTEEFVGEKATSKAAIYMRLGKSYFEQQNYQKSIEAYQQAKDIYVPLKKPYASIQALRQLIRAYQANKNYTRVLSANEEILVLDRQIGDSAAVAATLNNIGYAHKFLENYTKSISYFEQARKIEKRIGLPEDPLTLTNMGIVYQNMSQYDDALRYLKEAIDIEIESNNTHKLPQLYNIVAATYYQMGDLHNAREYNELAKQLSENQGQRRILQDVYLTASQIEQANSNYEEALKSYGKHLAIKDSILLEEGLRQQNMLQQQFLIERTEKELQLYMVDQELKDAQVQQQQLALEKQEQQLAILQQKQQLQDEKLEREALERQQTKQALIIAEQQLNAARAAREVADLQRLELDRKREVEKLEQEASLREQTLARERAEADRQQAEAKAEAQLKEAQNDAQKRIFALSGVLGLLILVVVGFAFLNSKKKNKALAEQKDQIESKNVELEQQTEEIQMQRDAISQKNTQLNELYVKVTDSVRYAQRIQEAILIPTDQIFEHFEDGFILFKPRDIVSGDFYWHSQKGNRTVLTAIDCTGHGVPGAFMSLIGNDLLNEIVNLRHITTPHQILNQLHEGVQSTLKQKQTSNRDGMDMALCVYDKEKNILEFAGAKNPLVYIKENEVFQIKADKKPIGGKDVYKQDTFKTHHIDLNEPDAPKAFYMFSDGYPDQFGGPKGRKFMIKKLRNLLLSIHQKPMTEQHKILDETIQDWMKNEEQIDDILIIGFRVS